MSDKQQLEALRMAELLSARRILNGDHGNPLDEAAAELRRLQAENEVLKAHCDKLLDACNSALNHSDRETTYMLVAAIASVKGGAA